jgi:Cu/Ag efflux pump CusA
MMRKRTRWLLLLLIPAVLLPLLLCGTSGWIAYRWLNSQAEPIVVQIAVGYPGGSAEEVERQVAIPLEVLLSGMPRLAAIRSRSSFGQCKIRLEYDHHSDYESARHQVINRLAISSTPLPLGVTPQIAPALPRNTVLRLTLTNPKGADGRPLYAAHDLAALRDSVLRSELLRVPGVAAVEGVGGAVKRYEVQPDPDRLRRYGITLSQLEKALTAANDNVGGAGRLGGGNDPMLPALTAKSPQQAAAHLHAEELRRLRELRQLVITTVNQVPVRVEDVADGGRLGPGADSTRGVLVGHQEPEGRRGEDDAVQAVVLRRHSESTEEMLRRIQFAIDEINETPGKLLPGVRIEIAAAGVDAARPDDFAEAFEAPSDGGLVKVFGPDLDGLAKAGETVRKQLAAIPGVETVRVIPEMSKARLSLQVDHQECARWGVVMAEAIAVVNAAFDGATCTQMVEGSERYDVVVRWPARYRKNEEAILNLPVDTGNGAGPAKLRLRLRDVVVPRDQDALVGAVVIYHENSKRMIAVSFRGDTRAAAAAQRAVAVPVPYWTEWVGR